MDGLDCTTGGVRRCSGGSESVCFGWVGLRGRDYVTTATVQEIRSNGLDLWGYVGREG